MNFENYASRIVSLTNFVFFEKPPDEYKEVSRLIVDKGEMQKKTSLKTNFSKFNGKRNYFSDGITSLPISHLLLKELAEYKKKMGQRIERYFWYEKEVLLDIENKAQEQHGRLFLYHQIFTSEPNYFLLEQGYKVFYSGRVMAVNYIYSSKFEGNVFIVGQTGCRKAAFIQTLAKNKMFGDLKKEIFWVSKIPLTSEREKT